MEKLVIYFGLYISTVIDGTKIDTEFLALNDAVKCYQTERRDFVYHENKIKHRGRHKYN